MNKHLPAGEKRVTQLLGGMFEQQALIQETEPGRGMIPVARRGAGPDTTQGKLSTARPVFRISERDPECLF